MKSYTLLCVQINLATPHFQYNRAPAWWRHENELERKKIEPSNSIYLFPVCLESAISNR